jgi:hypothetical protein
MTMLDFLLTVVVACSVLCLMAFTAGLIVAIGILGNDLLERTRVSAPNPQGNAPHDSA